MKIKELSKGESEFNSNEIKEVGAYIF